jgi:hypothetical protein
MAAQRVAALSIDRLELQPVARSHARPVRTVHTFGDDTFHVEARAGVEQHTWRSNERADRAPARPDEIARPDLMPIWAPRQPASSSANNGHWGAFDPLARGGGHAADQAGAPRVMS